MSNFKEKVLNIVKNIPRGKILTYKEVARLAKSPMAYRSVGGIMARNFDPKIPCHRVTKSDGTFGSYNRGGTKEKMRLLQEEGVVR